MPRLRGLAATLELAIKEAIEEQAPDLLGHRGRGRRGAQPDASPDVARPAPPPRRAGSRCRAAAVLTGAGRSRYAEGHLIWPRSMARDWVSRSCAADAAWARPSPGRSDIPERLRCREPVGRRPNRELAADETGQFGSRHPGRTRRLTPFAAETPADAPTVRAVRSGRPGRSTGTCCTWKSAGSSASATLSGAALRGTPPTGRPGQGVLRLETSLGRRDYGARSGIPIGLAFFLLQWLRRGHRRRCT